MFALSVLLCMCVCVCEREVYLTVYAKFCDRLASVMTYLLELAFSVEKHDTACVNVRFIDRIGTVTMAVSSSLNL